MPAKYLALDISHASLTHNISYLVRQHPPSSSLVRCAGLWGTFRDGKDYVQRIRGPRLFLSLGSVLCNDPWLEALNHLKYWVGAMSQDDLLLIGMDGHMASDHYDKIWAAYHSRDDLYHRFFLNGLDHANKLAKEEWFREDDWSFGAHLEDQPTTRHRFFLRAKREIRHPSLGRVIAPGEELDWFDSHKYDEGSVQLMCSKAGLSVVDVWKLPNSDFRKSWQRKSASAAPLTQAAGQYLLKVKDRGQREDADSAVSGV